VRVLITGAGGFVGVNLVHRFAAGGFAVDALARRAPDEPNTAFLADVAERVHWTLGDVTDAERCEALVAETRPDVIVHAAAVTFTAEQERAEPATVFDVNAVGTRNVLEAARRGGVGTFVYVSSGGLYGPADPVPALDETTPMRPGSMYAIAKIASEHLCVRYGELTGMRVRIGRLGTAYGPMERTTRSRSNMSAVHQVVSAAAPGVTLQVAGADVARDFCHVDDVSEAFWQLATHADLPEHTYNVGATVAAPLRVALDVSTRLVPGFGWVESEPADADVVQTETNARAAMDMRRLERDTPWRERYDLAAGIEAYVAWRRDHPELVRAISRA
jgi:nucleoside-diphosphate-sugar epimerase